MISADDCDGLRTAAAYAIAKIKNKSYKEYVVFNDFFAFLGDEARHNGYAFDIKPLPRQLTALERQITIAKMLHGKDDGGFSEDKLAEEFMERYGFTYCGIIYAVNGTPRLAYQKKIR